MVAEITQAQSSTKLSTGVKFFNTLPCDFAKTFENKLDSLKAETNNSDNSIQKSSKETAVTQGIYGIFSEIQTQDPLEKLREVAEFQMKADYIRMLGDKYPYGCVLTSGDDGNIVSAKIYREDGSYYQEDPSKLSNLLTSKDLKSIISFISEEDLQKYCSSKKGSVQAFVELLEKYDKEAKFDKNIHEKIAKLPELLDIYLVAEKKRQEEAKLMIQE